MKIGHFRHSKAAETRHRLPQHVKPSMQIIYISTDIIGPRGAPDLAAGTAWLAPCVLVKINKSHAGLCTACLTCKSRVLACNMHWKHGPAPGWPRAEAASTCAGAPRMAHGCMGAWGSMAGLLKAPNAAGHADACMHGASMAKAGAADKNGHFPILPSPCIRCQLHATAHAHAG
jgi:hypothetical protein